MASTDLAPRRRSVALRAWRVVALGGVTWAFTAAGCGSRTDFDSEPPVAVLDGSTFDSSADSSSGGTSGSGAEGGTTSTGGSGAEGGSVATGGSGAQGGSVATGGSGAQGGSVATGGSGAQGGSVATGGSGAQGGSVATGGAAGTGPDLCDPAFCPSPGFANACCVTETGPCGIERRNGECFPIPQMDGGRPPPPGG